MKIGDKIILEDLQDNNIKDEYYIGNIEWTIERAFKIFGKEYYLIAPNNNVNNKMIINLDKSVIIYDVLRTDKIKYVIQITKQEILRELKEAYGYEN